MSWAEEREKLRVGEITKEEYDQRRYHYPAFDDSAIKAKIPPDIQPDVQGPKKRGRKPKKAWTHKETLRRGFSSTAEGQFYSNNLPDNNLFRYTLQPLGIRTTNFFRKNDIILLSKPLSGGPDTLIHNWDSGFRQLFPLYAI